MAERTEMQINIKEFWKHLKNEFKDVSTANIVKDILYSNSSNSFYHSLWGIVLKMERMQ
jgi:hypothetical protein